MLSEGKPPPVRTEIVYWTRGADPFNDGYAWINVYEAHTIENAIPFFAEEFTPSQQIEGVGELAFRDDLVSAGWTFPHVTFKRCNAIVTVSVPFQYSDINVNTDSVIAYAQRIDERLQASSMCMN